MQVLFAENNGKKKVRCDYLQSSWFGLLAEKLAWIVLELFIKTKKRSIWNAMNAKIFCKRSLNDLYSVTAGARHKIQTVLERRDIELYGDFWCIRVAQSIYKVLLSEHRQKNEIHLDFSMCTSHYHNSSALWSFTSKMTKKSTWHVRHLE